MKPTIFANVRNDMTIAREEVFGPVLAILPYRDEAEAIRIANDTVYGLSGYVTSASIERARTVARLLLNALRSVPELVWAALLLIAVGLGPSGASTASTTSSRPRR